MAEIERDDLIRVTIEGVNEEVYATGPWAKRLWSYQNRA